MNPSNIDSDVTSTAKDSPQGIKYTIFVTSEQVLDTSVKASIQHAATKVTNIGNKLSSKASPLLRKSELLYIRDKISYNDIKYYFAFLQKDRESGV